MVKTRAQTGQPPSTGEATHNATERSAEPPTRSSRRAAASVPVNRPVTRTPAASTPRTRGSATNAGVKKIKGKTPKQAKKSGDGPKTTPGPKKGKASTAENSEAGAVARRPSGPTVPSQPAASSPSLKRRTRGTNPRSSPPITSPRSTPPRPKRQKAFQNKVDTSSPAPQSRDDTPAPAPRTRKTPKRALTKQTPTAARSASASESSPPARLESPYASLAHTRSSKSRASSARAITKSPTPRSSLPRRTPPSRRSASSNEPHSATSPAPGRGASRGISSSSPPARSVTNMLADLTSPENDEADSRSIRHLNRNRSRSVNTSPPQQAKSWSDGDDEGDENKRPTPTSPRWSPQTPPPQRPHRPRASTPRTPGPDSVAPQRYNTPPSPRPPASPTSRGRKGPRPRLSPAESIDDLGEDVGQDEDNVETDNLYVPDNVPDEEIHHALESDEDELSPDHSPRDSVVGRLPQRSRSPPADRSDLESAQGTRYRGVADSGNPRAGPISLPGTPFTPNTPTMQNAASEQLLRELQESVGWGG